MGPAIRHGGSFFRCWRASSSGIGCTWRGGRVGALTTCGGGACSSWCTTCVTQNNHQLLHCLDETIRWTWSGSSNCSAIGRAGISCSHRYSRGLEGDHDGSGFVSITEMIFESSPRFVGRTLCVPIVESQVKSIIDTDNVDCVSNYLVFRDGWIKAHAGVDVSEQRLDWYNGAPWLVHLGFIVGQLLGCFLVELVFHVIIQLRESAAISELFSEESSLVVCMDRLKVHLHEDLFNRLVGVDIDDTLIMVSFQLLALMIGHTNRIDRR